MKYFCLIAIVLLAGFGRGAVAQSDHSEGGFDKITGAPYVVPGAKVHTVQSNIVNQLYELGVSVPGDYFSQPQKEYPVVYVLDGQ